MGSVGRKVPAAESVRRHRETHGRAQDAGAEHLSHIGHRVLRDLVRVRIIRCGGLRRDPEGAADHSHRLLPGDGAGGQRRALIAQIDAGGMELQDGILPIGPGGIREGVRRRGVLKMEKTVQNSRKSAACDGFIRTERTIVISLNDPILPGPLIDGGLRPVSVRIRKRVGRHDGAAHRQSRRCQPLSKMPLHSCSFLSKPVESIPKKRHGPYGPVVLCRPTAHYSETGDMCQYSVGNFSRKIM